MELYYPFTINKDLLENKNIFKYARAEAFYQESHLIVESHYLKRVTVLVDTANRKTLISCSYSGTWLNR